MRKIQCEPFDSEFTAYLDGLKPHTRNAYRSLFAYWINYTKMNGKQTLEFGKNDKDALTQKMVVSFKKYLISLGKSENFGRLGTAAIRGFFASHRMKLEFIRSEKRIIEDVNRKTEDYLFVREDIVKMVSENVSPTLQERYILLVGKSVGLRAGDFINFTYGDFRSVHIEGEIPIALGRTKTGKEHVPAFPFLDTDAVPIVKAILERNPTAKNTDKILDIGEESLTETIQRLFEKAHLESGGKRVRFHNLRKYLIDRLSAVASESQWKQIVGKSISESAYVSQDQLRPIYERAMPSIVIGNGNGAVKAKIEALSTTTEQLVQMLSAKDKAIEELKTDFEEHKRRTLDEMVNTKQMIEERFKIEHKEMVELFKKALEEVRQ